jgi:hypothetical protein
MLKKVIEELGLERLLQEQFGDQAGLVLDLASYTIVSEDNAGQYYPDYAFRHPLFTAAMRVMSDSTVSRFFNSVTKDQILGFFNAWNKGMDHRQRIYVSYDSTNKNCQAGDVDIVEFGKPKDDKGLPIFNLSLAFDKTNRIPLFYEEYPGSIADVSQFRYFVDKILSYGYRHLGFILDRGYFSEENIRYMDKTGYQFVIMVKGCKALVSDIVEENRGTFEQSRRCMIGLHKAYGTTVDVKRRPSRSTKRHDLTHLIFL